MPIFSPRLIARSLSSRGTLTKLFEVMRKRCAIKHCAATWYAKWCHVRLNFAVICAHSKPLLPSYYGTLFCLYCLLAIYPIPPT